MLSALVENASFAKPRNRGRWIYVPQPEEIPMTFQVGIVGADGVLLASDLRYVRGGPDVSRRTYSSEKIVVREDKNLAYCSAGDNAAARVAEHHADTFTVGGNIKKNLEDSRASVMREYQEQTGSRNWHGSIMVVHGREDSIELWHIDLDDQPAQRLNDRACGGDLGNPAVFFLERYLQGNEPSLTLEQLKMIAAHSVLMSGKLNPTGIQGLEIVLCRKNGFERVSPAELSRLKARSEELDSQVTTALGMGVVIAESGLA